MSTQSTTQTQTEDTTIPTEETSSWGWTVGKWTLGLAAVGGVGYGVYRLCTGNSSAVEAVAETAEAVRGFISR